jgi:hypothetical protein
MELERWRTGLIFIPSYINTHFCGLHSFTLDNTYSMSIVVYCEVVGPSSRAQHYSCNIDIKECRLEVEVHLVRALVRKYHISVRSEKQASENPEIRIRDVWANS